MRDFGILMSIEDPSDDSIMGVLRTEMRNRPVRLALTLFLFIAAALLMPSAEVHEAGRPVITSSQIDLAHAASSVVVHMFSIEQPTAGDEKTTLDAETLNFEKLPLTPPRIACFPESPKTSLLFR